MGGWVTYLEGVLVIAGVGGETGVEGTEEGSDGFIRTGERGTAA